MKALMYHYVRSPRGDLPHFRFLHRDNFISQVRLLKEEIGLVPKSDFLEWVMDPHGVRKPEGAVLTFDDGLSDHFDVVAPLLAEERAWGLFYVPTGIWIQNSVLDVHRVHLLLGYLGGDRCLELLQSILPEHKSLTVRQRDWVSKTYSRQKYNDASSVQFKRMLNYVVGYASKSELIDSLVAASGIPDDTWRQLVDCFYMTEEMVRQLHDNGHIIGSHSVSHRLMSFLSEHEQEQEIRDSLETLTKTVREPVQTFCYPYGGFHSFSASTENILSRSGVSFSFNVEPRDIGERDLLTRPQALPRYDCNRFPFGESTEGQ